MTPAIAALRPDRSWLAGLASPAAATVLGAFALVLVAGYVVTAGLAGQQTALNVVPTAIVLLIYVGAGVVIARRQPRNTVGWILLVFGVLYLLASDAGYYAVSVYSRGRHGLPLAPAAVLLPLWVPAAAMLPLVILLFPDGELTSRRWRVTLWVYAGLWACVAAAIWVPTITAVARHDVHLDSFGDVTTTGHGHGLLTRRSAGGGRRR